MWEDGEEGISEDILRLTTEEIVARTRLLENDIKVMRSETSRLAHEQKAMQESIKDNLEKARGERRAGRGSRGSQGSRRSRRPASRSQVKVNKQLPFLVGNVVEILDVAPEDEQTDGANVDLDAQVGAARGASLGARKGQPDAGRAARGQRKGKCAVIKTSTRQTIFLPGAWGRGREGASVKGRAR